MVFHKVLAASIVLITITSAAAAPAPQWQARLIPAHAKAMAQAEGRLDDLAYWRDMAQQEFAGSEKPKPATALFAAITSKPPLPFAGTALVGDWKCRALRVENNGLTVFPFVNCRVTKTATGFSFDKFGGSRLVSGALFARSDKSMVLLSSWRDAGQPRAAYGAKAETSDVGFVFKSAPDKFRIEFPSNSLSLYDVIELVKSPKR